MRTSDFTLVINDLSVDTLPLFIQLAADTESAYKEIDLLYETDRPRFQSLVSLSPYANHPLFSTGGIDRQIYASKYSGIVLAAIEDGCDSSLFKKTIAIMIKRWNELYCYISNCETVDLSEVVHPQYYSIRAKNSYNHNLLAGASTRYIQTFITLFPTLDLPLQASLKFSMFMACACRRKVTVTNPTTLSFIQILSSRLDSTDQMLLLKNRLNKPAVKKMARDLKNVIYQKIFNNYLDPWHDDRLLEGLAHCNAYLSLQEGISLLSPKIMTQAKERDVELLCRLYIIKMAAESFRSGHLEKNKEDMELDCTEFVMFGLNLLDFVREYKKAKKYYFEQNAAYLSTEVDHLKKQLRGCEAEIRRINADLAAKSNLLTVKEAELNRLVLQQKFILNSVMKENEQLKATLAQSGKNKDKVLSIKTMPATNAVTALNHPLGTEASLKALEKVHALVIGGTNNWQAKLKGKLPHFTYLQGDTTNFNGALIINADIVFANVRCKFSHDCFYKIIKLVRQHEKSLVFLSKTNISLTIRQMATAVDKSSITEDTGIEYNDIGYMLEL